MWRGTMRSLYPTHQLDYLTDMSDARSMCRGVYVLAYILRGSCMAQVSTVRGAKVEPLIDRKTIEDISNYALEKV